jgi:hypothetical protein
MVAVSVARRSSSLDALTWIGHEGNEHVKHRGLIHPLMTMLLHYAVIIPVTFYAHDYLLQLYNVSSDQCNFEQEYSHRARRVAIFCFVYSIWLLLWRLYFFKPAVYRASVIYEFCWLCNVSLIVGGLGLYLNKPIIAQAYCVTVGIDQLLWYVDLSWYFFTGKFPIGVSKYIFWEGTSWSTRITCWHHVWTLPLLLWGARGMHGLAFPLSFLVMICNVCFARFTTPFVLSDGKTDHKYLNVNLSHELWKDIKFKLLQINYDDPHYTLYLFRLLWRWECFNLAVFIILYGICRLVYGQAPVC